MLLKEDIAKLIDSTILRPESIKDEICKLCEDAIEYNFFSVCVNPTWVKYCKDKLNDSSVKVCSVIGFPLGALSTVDKVNESLNAIKNGVDELDMVINIGFLKGKQMDLFEKDIAKVREVAKNKLLKVIIETCLLTDEEKIIACEITKKVGADFVKTSTGFSSGGATVEDISLMRKTVGNDFGVKASGGIRTLDDVLKMLNAGASRIGTSNGVNIIKEVK